MTYPESIFLTACVLTGSFKTLWIYIGIKVADTALRKMMEWKEDVFRDES